MRSANYRRNFRRCRTAGCARAAPALHLRLVISRWLAAWNSAHTSARTQQHVHKRLTARVTHMRCGGWAHPGAWLVGACRMQDGTPWADARCTAWVHLGRVAYGRVADCSWTLSRPKVQPHACEMPRHGACEMRCVGAWHRMGRMAPHGAHDTAWGAWHRMGRIAPHGAHRTAWGASHRMGRMTPHGAHGTAWGAWLRMGRMAHGAHGTAWDAWHIGRMTQGRVAHARDGSCAHR
eukprot:355650-Chlamydomonas_euryale.AAC.3